MSEPTHPRVLVIGAGVAGLGAAHALSGHAHVTLLERDDRLGGHAHTVVHYDPQLGPLDLDTGFLVYNPATYPRLVALFDELDVAWQHTEMSFSVSCERCGIEYSGRQLWRQPSLVLDRRVHALLMEIVRFLRRSPAHVDDPRHRDDTLDDYVRRHGHTDAFRDHFLVPLTAAIWSMSPGQVRRFPIAYALAFYRNHSLLGFRRNRWRNVVGGSARYVEAIASRVTGEIATATPVERLERHDRGVTAVCHDGRRVHADAAVVATHPDAALALIDGPTAAERDTLGALPYTRSTAVLHTDARLIPRRPACRAAWNYQLADCRDPHAAPTMTYYLNRLQRLDTTTHYMVTLNRGAHIDPARVIRTLAYDHPRYTFESLAAQAGLEEIQGTRRTWYAGAYHGYGFHEDGLRSGQDAAARVRGAL